MATYKANDAASVFRIGHAGLDCVIGGQLTLPAGTVLAAGDVLLFGELGENQIVKEVYVGGINTGAVAASIGAVQILNKDGSVYTVKRNGPFSDAANTFPSPATSAAKFAPAAALSDAATTPQAAISKLSGPVYLAATVTTGATIGSSPATVVVQARVIGEVHA